VAKVLADHEPSIKDIQLIPADGGRFEVVINGELIYSKLETGRHLDEGEMSAIVQGYLSEHA
jgi:selenoprotein W-related protein